MTIKDPIIRKQKHKEYSAQHYQRNKEEIKAKSKVRNENERKKFADFKATLSCTECGENHPATLDFHHHTPHPDNIKIHMLIRYYRYAFAMKEIEEKCIVLCSNCHRKHHFNERLAKKQSLNYTSTHEETMPNMQDT